MDCRADSAKPQVSNMQYGPLRTLLTLIFITQLEFRGYVCHAWFLVLGGAGAVLVLLATWHAFIFPVVSAYIELGYLNIELVFPKQVAMVGIVLWQTVLLFALTPALAIQVFGFVKRDRVIRVYYARTQDTGGVARLIILKTLLSLVLVCEGILYPVMWQPFLHDLSRENLAGLISVKLLAYGATIFMVTAGLYIAMRIQRCDRSLAYAWGFWIIIYGSIFAFSYRMYYEATHPTEAVLLLFIAKNIGFLVQDGMLFWTSLSSGLVASTALFAGRVYLGKGLRHVLL